MLTLSATCLELSTILVSNIMFALFSHFYYYDQSQKDFFIFDRSSDFQ